MGSLTPTPQTGDSHYAPLLKREHERLDWSWRATDLHDQIRGLNPWPGAFAIFRGENIKFWRSTPFIRTDRAVELEKESEAGSYAKGMSTDPGQIIQVLGDSLLVQTGEGVLRVLEVQPAGKRSMLARDFFNGRHGQVGEKFD